MNVNLQTTLEAVALIRQHMGELYWRPGAENPKFESREIADTDLIGKVKKDSPLLHTVQTRRGYVVPSCVIWLDFDVLPSMFKTWDSFRDHLVEQGLGLVFSTPSGKAKVACFGVTGFAPFKASASYSKVAALALCPAELRPFLDTSTATQLCFITENMFCLNVYATHPIHKLREVVDAYAEETRKDRPTIVLSRTYEAELPTDLPAEVQNNANMTKLLRLLLCFNKAEFDLPQITLAKTLGCGVGTVNRLLSTLKKLNILKVTNDSYMVGKKAITYKFEETCSLGQLHASLRVSTPTATQSEAPRAASVEDLKEVAPLAKGSRYANTPAWFNALRRMGVTDLEEMASIMAANSELPTPTSDYLANLRCLARKAKFGVRCAA